MKRLLIITMLLVGIGTAYADQGDAYEMLTANTSTVINTRDINFITIHSVNVKQAVRGRSELIINVEITKSNGEHTFEQYVEILEPGHTLYSTFVSDGQLQTVGE